MLVQFSDFYIIIMRHSTVDHYHSGLPSCMPRVVNNSIRSVIVAGWVVYAVFYDLWRDSGGTEELLSQGNLAA